MKIFEWLSNLVSKFAFLLYPVYDPSVRIERTSPFVQTPRRSREGDACIDIQAAYTGVVTQQPRVFRTELNIAIPDGHVGLLCSRSGLSSKGVFVVNAPGVIDANYRGEILVVLASTFEQNYFVQAGDRIAQLLIIPLEDIPVIGGEINTNETARGSAGLGSSGR